MGREHCYLRNGKAMRNIRKCEYIKWFWKYIDDERPVLLFAK